MGHLSEVEFFTDAARVPASDEDTVDFGHGQVPRWVTTLAVLVAAALVVGFAASSHHPPAASGPPGANSSLDAPPSTVGLGKPIEIGPGTPPLDLAVSVPLYLLQSGHLYKVTDASAVGVALDGPGFANVATSAQLVLDAAANRVWVVVLGIPGGEIVEFDARNLRRLRTMHWPEPIGDAAALSGHLYLAATTGLADVAPGAVTPRLITGMRGYVASVAADPKRARLLALVLGSGTWVRQLPVGGTVGGAEAVVPVGKGNLRVTQEGAIWVGGFASSTDGAVLMRLDPTTLRPVAASPLASRLGSGGWIESAGDRDVWIRSTVGEGELWCVDGRSGSVLQHWPSVPGTVTSRRGTAFVMTGGSLVPLVLDGCTG
jgi:hypothetical protein